MGVGRLTRHPVCPGVQTWLPPIGPSLESWAQNKAQKSGKLSIVN